MGKVRVLLVDDSSVIRGIITRILKEDESIEIVGAAPNGQIGVDTYRRLKPDVVLMDIEMPVMDGITALGEIMKEDRRAKVIMCSTLTVENADITMRAMRIGAIDYIPKPSNSLATGDSAEFKERLLRLVKAIRGTGADMNTTAGAEPRVIKAGVAVAKHIDLRPVPPLHWKAKVLSIGSSTGGPQALFAFMKELNGINLPVVITQHMPATFTTMLAQHITQMAGFPCVEGTDGMALEKGKAILAPGGKHMGFESRADGTVVVKINDGPQENFCKPAVDVMLRSLMEHYDSKILSVILTGMGSDGAKSTAQLISKGGYCVAQDQETSIVWGMPGAVATTGLCSAVLPLNQIAPWVKDYSHAGIS